MTNIAQTVNVLQAMILTEGEKMILTPTYHVFDMYKVHIGLCNIDHQNDAVLDLDLRGVDESITKIAGTILTADSLNAHNTFEQPDAVKPVEFNAVKVVNNKLALQLPPMSIVTLTMNTPPT